ncbi:MAG: hypothetical protein AAGF33_05935 [Pseudomonadota bacterium]
MVGPEAIRQKYRTLFELMEGTEVFQQLVTAYDIAGVLGND